MDGNRRWATNQGLMPWYGHKKGFDALKRTVDFCLEKKISYVSLYTYSIENLKRSAAEQSYLFDVLAQEVLGEFEELNRKGVRVRFIGDRGLFPKNVRPLCEKIERESESNSLLQLNFLFCYGGQQEIVDATKRIAIKVVKGDLQIQDITPELFERFLWTSTIPFPDLILRTGGDDRLSNFLLFQCAYSELYFIDCLWPDISVQNLESALTYFDSCRKNLGR